MQQLQLQPYTSLFLTISYTRCVCVCELFVLSCLLPLFTDQFLVHFGTIHSFLVEPFVFFFSRNLLSVSCVLLSLLLLKLLYINIVSFLFCLLQSESLSKHLHIVPYLLSICIFYLFPSPMSTFFKTSITLFLKLQSYSFALSVLPVSLFSKSDNFVSVYFQPIQPFKAFAKRSKGVRFCT